MSPAADRWATAAVAVAVFVGVTALAVRHVTDEPERGGSLHNLSMAYNLWKHGVVSSDQSDDPARVAPDWRREPLYSVLLAGVLAVAADPAAVDHACLAHAEPRCRGLLRGMKSVNAALMGAMAAGVWLTARGLGAGWLAAGGACFLIAASGAFWRILDRLKTEPLAACLVLAACAALHLAATARTPRRGQVAAGAAGLALGGLVLTKAIFLYAAPVLLAGAALAARRPGDRTGRRVVAAVLVGWTLAGAWIGRNAYHGAGLTLAEDRDVLAVRAEHDTMTWREYAAAWIYFPSERNPMARWLLERWFEPEDWERLYDENPNSFYHLGKHGLGAVAARSGVERPDAEQMHRAARQVVLDRWVMHLALTGPFAARGIWVAWPVFSWTPLWWGMWVAVNLFLPAIFALAALRAWQRRWDHLWLVALPLYSFALHAFATHYIVRYSWPLMPVGAVALALLAHAAARRLLPRLAA